jgi:hypothetical protein
VTARLRLKAARESLRELGRGLSPRYRPGHEPLVIDELISPLRYDVMIRSHFFETLAEHRALFDDDPDGFVRLVRGTDYHTWYTTVAVHAIGITGQPEAAIDEAFHRRVLRSAALADSVAEKGFIARPPLTIRSSDGAEIASGKRLGSRHYPLDGCHRLALLRQLGRRELQPGEYRVTTSGPVLDNTARLLPNVGLDAAGYHAFIGLGYVREPVSSWEELLAAVATERPERLAEVESVLAADLPD